MNGQGRRGGGAKRPGQGGGAPQKPAGPKKPFVAGAFGKGGKPPPKPAYEAPKTRPKPKARPFAKKGSAAAGKDGPRGAFPVARTPEGTRAAPVARRPEGTRAAPVARKPEDKPRRPPPGAHAGPRPGQRVGPGSNAPLQRRPEARRRESGELPSVDELRRLAQSAPESQREGEELSGNDESVASESGTDELDVDQLVATPELEGPLGEDDEDEDVGDDDALREDELDDAPDLQVDDDEDDFEPLEPEEPKPVGPHRAGFVAIVGRPNVGKSTLLNRLLGQKVAIVSPKPQTTRTRILGVVTRPDAQFALLDTPGLHEARGGLNARMVQSALQTLSDADAALFLIEAGSPAIDSATRKALEQVKAAGKPLLLVINKIDLVPRHELLPLIGRWKDEHDWTEVYPLSAQTGENVDRFLDALARHLPEGPALFGPETWTDVPERDLCAELVREQLLRRTEKEVPYSTAVLIEQFDETERDTGPRGLVRIYATVLVERDSQKAIVIGKGGAMLRDIGTASRREMERLLGCKVFLQLHVKVEPRWTETERGLRKAGYEEKK